MHFVGPVTHPGQITLVDESIARTRIVDATSIARRARYVRSESGALLPVTVIIKTKNGMVASYGSGRKLLSVTPIKDWET